MRHPVRTVSGPQIGEHCAAALLTLLAYLLDKGVDSNLVAEQRGPGRHSRACQATSDDRDVLEQVPAPVRGIDMRDGLRGWGESLLAETLSWYDGQSRTASQHHKRSATKDEAKCACDCQLV